MSVGLENTTVLVLAMDCGFASDFRRRARCNIRLRLRVVKQLNNLCKLVSGYKDLRLRHTSLTLGLTPFFCLFTTAASATPSEGVQPEPLPACFEVDPVEVEALLAPRGKGAGVLEPLATVLTLACQLVTNPDG